MHLGSTGHTTIFDLALLIGPILCGLGFNLSLMFVCLFIPSYYL